MSSGWHSEISDRWQVASEVPQDSIQKLSSELEDLHILAGMGKLRELSHGVAAEMANPAFLPRRKQRLSCWAEMVGKASVRGWRAQ